MDNKFILVFVLLATTIGMMATAGVAAQYALATADNQGQGKGEPAKGQGETGNDKGETGNDKGESGNDKGNQGKGKGNPIPDPGTGDGEPEDGGDTDGPGLIDEEPPLPPDDGLIMYPPAPDAGCNTDGGLIPSTPCEEPQVPPTLDECYYELDGVLMPSPSCQTQKETLTH